MTTTTETTTTRTCPPSAVTDMIVPWEDVQPGDLVLWDGHLVPVERSASFPGDPGCWLIRLAGAPEDLIPCGNHAAVRRYTEGTSEREALIIAALDRAAEDCEQQALAWDCRACAGSEHGPGKCPEHQEYLTQALEFRAERDRREAGR